MPSQVELVQGEGATPVDLHAFLVEQALWAKADVLLLLAIGTAVVTLLAIITVVVCYRGRG